MGIFSKQIDKRIALYQQELIETHYQEVENGSKYSRYGSENRKCNG